MLSNAKLLQLSDLPPFIHEKDGPPLVYWISASLKDALEASGAHKGQVVGLPPIMDLARLFKTSHLEVHDAFQHLRRHGYDYNLTGMDAPIPFWYTRICDEQEPDSCR